MKRFEGKSVLVTGAASGIGAATVARLAQEGARILACDIDATRLQGEVERLAAAGFDVAAHPLDIADGASCHAAIAAAVARHGKLDVLCNIAGIMSSSHFTDVTDAEWQRALNINLTGAFFLCRAAVPHLLANKGNIVNVASIAGVVGFPGCAAYSASKGALLALSKTLAVEYAGRGLRVNAVCPGYVDTPMTQGFTPLEGGDKAMRGRLMPLTPYGAQPVDIAAAVAYLAADEARFVTGTALIIDGGQTAI